jgi:hypothetical protein
MIKGQDLKVIAEHAGHEFECVISDELRELLEQELEFGVNVAPGTEQTVTLRVEYIS